MPAAKWQLREAKKRLSEMVRKAQREGLRVITLHGSDAAVVVSARDYRRPARRNGTLVDFFRKSPLVGVELKLTPRTGGCRCR